MYSVPNDWDLYHSEMDILADPSSPCPWEMEAPRCSPVRRQVTNCPLPWLYPLPKHLQRKSQLGSSMSSGKNTKNYEVQVHILNQEVVANHGGPPCGVKMLPWPTKKLFESRLLLAQYDFWWQTSGSTGPNGPQCHLGNSQKFHDLALQRNVGQKLPGRTIGSTPVSLRSTSKSTFHQAYRDDIIHYVYIYIYI